MPKPTAPFLFAAIALFLLAYPCAGATQLFFPQIADGGGYQTALLLTNRGLGPTNVTVSFTTSAGAPMEVTINGKTGSLHQFVLPALGSTKVETSGAPSAASTGWASVSTSPPTDIQGNAVFNLARVGEASVPAAPPTSFADFVADEDGRFRTGFAISNPGQVEAVGTLTLRESDGTNPKVYNIRRSPQTHEARFLYEVMPGTHSGRAEIKLTTGRVSVTALRFDTSSGTFSTVSVGLRSVYVSGSCADIQQAIDSLPPGGGQVIIEADTYVCSRPIVIDRDDVDLRGQGSGTVLKLADHADCPVMIVGQLSTPPGLIRRNIRVSDLSIDGNRAQQTMECWSGPCDSGGLTFIRNSGIAVRGVEDVRVEDVTVHSASSGGLVSEKGCRRLAIRGLTSFDNRYDGLASYETEDSVFSGLNLYNNEAAGLSFDINFNHNTISDSTIAGSGTVGIFMRHARDNVFAGIRVRNSAQYGVYLAQVNNDDTKPAAGNTFYGLVVADSKWAGLRVDNPSCVNNTVCASQFVGNKDGAISEARPGLVQACVNISR
jgi:hypothetical protein